MSDATNQEILDELKKDQRIGQLNGRWSIAFRWCIGAIIIGIPYVVGFNAWVVNSLNKLDTNQQLIAQKLETIAGREGDWYTKAEVDLALTKQAQSILEKISEEYPPKWLQQR